MQQVVNSFANDHRVSTYLWDFITTKRVDEYAVEDLTDGYVVKSTPNPQTRLLAFIRSSLLRMIPT